jgi:PHD/YefM family antitoxin component YafN of YafNO toxin-antitoxin module
MKSITATKFRQGNMEAAYNTVCAHSPVTIISKDRPDITMVLATDYEEMKLELEKLREKLLTEQEMLNLAWSAIQEAGYEDHCYALNKHIND